jgi:eukaryotic-like serine/threonine-protein kinase
MSGHAAQSQGASAPPVGELIAKKYRVESVVGRGGMGVVVSARHVQLGQAVAIKLLTLPADEDRRDEAIARFLHEAQAAARLHSDHVVRIYDVGQLDDGLPFMVMELLTGQDLGTVLDERGPLPEPEAVDYVLQACAGIAEAHLMGIVHRDLKPSNLFVTRRSDGLPLLKVLDFGISKQVSDPGSGQAVPTFTNTRTLMGSPNYMSPEQVRDARRVDGRADIWAMGIILQELLTDAPVFHGESFPGVCAAIVADPPMPVRTLRPDVSVALEAIIGRCLEKDVKRRYQTISELVADLSPLGSRSVSGGTSQPLVYSSHPRLIRVERTPSGASLNEDRTVAMPSGPEPTPAPQRSGTLESARLGAAGGSTHDAVSSPDSRVAIVSPPPVPDPPRPRRFPRLAAPLALAALLLGGLVWLQTRERGVPSAESREQPRPRAPVKAEAPLLLDITSEPAGAAVSEGSVKLGVTPFALPLSMTEGATPRVFVLEKEGYEPYVVRQGYARGQVRVLATLKPTLEAQRPTPSSSVAVPSAPPSPAGPRKPQPPSQKKPLVVQPQPPSDIRLER